MGKKDRERQYQVWLADVKIFYPRYPLAPIPSDARLRQLYDTGYGSEQAARQLIKEINQ